MGIKASDIKELRSITGAGMLDCKKALVKTEGDIDEAVKHLREKGLSKAAKKSGRVAAEGLVKIASNDSEAAIVEVNSETDFVAKNEDFINFVNKVATQALNSESKDIELFLEEKWLDDDSKKVKDVVTEKIATIGENINVRRFKKIKTDDNTVAKYIHGDGQIGVIIVIEGDSSDDLETAAKNIAMQVAATNPKYISREDVSDDYLASEKEVLKNQALNEGKPEHIVEKMVEGRLNKKLQEICLVDQAYVRDTDMTVEAYLKSVDSDAKIVNMVRFETGEGIEKKQENFADEVAKQIDDAK